MTSWERFFYGVLAVCMVVTLGGCEVVRAGYHACREGLCR